MLKNFSIWAIAIALAVVSGTTALGAIAKKITPELAVSIKPVNGFATEAMALRMVRSSIQKDQGTFPTRINPAFYNLALLAFKSEPTGSGAVATIALFQSGNKRRQMMEKAFDLSRRQLLVTGWLIADSGAKGDMGSILNYYDAMLRTSSSASEVVIPVMAGALADDAAVEPFATILSSNPPWADTFWGQVVRRPDLVANALKLRQRLYKPNEREGAFRDGALIDELVQNYYFKSAERHYELLTKSANTGDIVRNSDFGVQSRYPPFDWRLYSTGEYGASIQRDSLSLSAIQNSGGLFARQLVKLPDRVLKLNAEFNQTIPSNAVLYLELSCAEKIPNRPKGIKIPVTEKSIERTISNKGSSCEYYWFDIGGRSTDNGTGFDVGLNRLSLTAS
ncbi:hypothetical protein [Parasphingorhabdus sp.]|uniref:hypothetical protein n=1 Tax=Parasphingorhabdus sp. TaxID=2709688 RepID=UPI003BB11E9C